MTVMWYVPTGAVAPFRVEVVKLTSSSCLLVDGSRIPRRCVFREWDAAHASLVRWAEDNVTAARLQLERVRGISGSIRGLKKPKGAP